MNSPLFDHDESINCFSNPFGYDTPINIYNMEHVLDSFNSCEGDICGSPLNSEENSDNKPTSPNSNNKAVKGPKCVEEIQISNSEKNLEQNVIKQNEVKFHFSTEIKKDQIKIDNLKDEDEKPLSHSKSKIEDMDFYHLEEIKRKFLRNSKIENILEGGKNTSKIEENFMSKSNKSTEENEDLDKNENSEFLQKKRRVPDPDEKKVSKKEGKGRTKIGSEVEGEHTKLKEDNLMFKIKSNFNNWILNLVNSFLEDDQKLLKMNFVKFSKNINAKDNLVFLTMKLYDIFDSLEISSIYSKVNREQGPNVNKKKIKEIMEGNNEKVKKMLNLTYEEWLDIYRLKDIQPELIGEIGEYALKGRVIDFLEKAYNDEIKDLKKRQKNEREAIDFISSLSVMIYNYRLWFSMKKPRKKRAKQDQNNMVSNSDKKQIIL